jgi:hypothetical protein
MYRKITLGILLCLNGYVSAHEWTPTYPKLYPSFVEGILVAKMELFNSRQDINYYQVSVWDEEWKEIPFSLGGSSIIHVDHLQRKTVEVYIREKDRNKVTYICSRSKTLTNEDNGTFLSSRICSKVK